MSFDYSYSFAPLTPPEFNFEEVESLNTTSTSFSQGHSRSGSHASMYSYASSPESINTQLTTPARSPIRQHGPLLLPKIRPQDQEIHSPPKRFKTMPVPKKRSQAFRPSHARSYTNPESISFSNDNFPSHTRSMTTLCSPITFTTPPPDNQCRASSAELDGQTLGKYGFPTYRQMPTYIPSASNSGIETFSMPPQYFQAPQRTPSPLQNTISMDELATINPLDDGTNTNLMAYLTSPNPAPALVRQLNIHVRDTNTKHFWWDIRQIRPWIAFNPATISAIPGLNQLLNISLPTLTFPTPPRTSSQPETELELQNIYNSFYATKLNAALSLSLGPRHLVIRQGSTKGSSEPSFISNYTDDNSQLIYGRGLGRVVGLVKSFDRWNTGMRVEGNHRKVEYLRGLSHLHRQMRENNCRYGFIMTEIELVVVRNGGENVPHFGYLEIQTIQLAAHDTQTSTFEEVEGSFVDAGEENVVQKQPKMTALLALWYLHMLARDDALPGQVGWKSEIGAPAEGTRRKCLPKDEWIPEPQLAEKREAKRMRGWVWPEEAVGRKELGKRGVRYGC